VLEVNLWAVLVAGIAPFVLGGAWYSTVLFGALWRREAGVAEVDAGKSHGARVFAAAIVLSLVAAYVFALLIGPRPPLGFAVRAGFVVGLFWVATAFGINYAFAGRSFRLFLIDAAYHIAQFTLYGLILGLWH